MKVRPLYLILIVWLIFSYLAPYIKSVIGTPVLHIRYTIITLPAWILIFTIGWTKIKKINLKYFFVGVITLSAICNLFLFRKYYTKIQKQQFREVAQVVNSRNFDHTPIATDLAWHFNFYFRNTPHKAGNLSSIDFSSVDKFWLLYTEFFTPQEKESLLKNFSETFEIQEEHNFYKSAALLMTRKKLSK